MLFSILLLLVIAFLAYKIAPRENKEHAHVHGAGQIGLLAAVALFGVDYFTSYFYATGELMSALHPYGLQHYGYLAAGLIAFANLVFGGLSILPASRITHGPIPSLPRSRCDVFSRGDRRQTPVLERSAPALDERSVLLGGSCG